MANQIVRLADQFVFRITGNRNERRIAVLDAAGQVGRGDEHL